MTMSIDNSGGKVKSHVGSGLAGAVKVIVRFFLESEHFKQLYMTLAEQWAGTHSLSAAVRLMEKHGASITKEEQARLADLPEDRMIDAFICKMPQQSREQFEQFFLQLSMIATSTTRLRQGMEAGDPRTIEDVLTSAENVGILTFILKMAVAQAGAEANNKVLEADEFLEASERKIGPLLQSQADWMIESDKLAKASAQFGVKRTEASSKSKKFLMTLSSGSADVLYQMCFQGWVDLVKQNKREEEIRKQYEEQIEQANKNLLDYKFKAVERIKGVLMRDIESQKGKLLKHVFEMFRDELFDGKTKQGLGKSVDEFENQLKKFAADAKANAKGVLARMNAGNEEALVHMCLTAWIGWSQDYKKDKELEEAVKASEKRIADFLSSHKENSKGILNKLSEGSDTGLVTSSFREWAAFVKDEKAQMEMQDQLNAKGSKFDQFASRNAGTAMTEMTRMASVTDMHLVILCSHLWKREIKLDKMRRHGRDRNQKKTQQLKGVKNLFKNFATELDQGLKGTPRVEGQPEAAPVKDAPKADPS